MKYLALACDYDGTIAHHGRVDEATIDALERVRASRRKLILVTGRVLSDLREVLPRLDLFDLVVAENGALVYDPESQEVTVLAEAPPQQFVDDLRRRGVEPLSQGKVIVATWEPHETAVLEAIRDQGLELQVIFNKGAVMVLPSGINKAFGLRAALAKLQLSPHNTVGAGDAENDHAFLTLCECSAAVANALPALKEHVDLVTAKDHGEGVRELIDELIESDLQGREATLKRPLIPLGRPRDGGEIVLAPLSEDLMIAGESGGGKSTLVKSILESLVERNYQFCIIDPEGDYEGMEGAVIVGDQEHEPDLDEVLALLEQPDQNVTVNLLNVPIKERPAYFDRLLEVFHGLYQRTGRPHRLVLDEAHHLLPASAPAPQAVLKHHCQALILVTVHPEHVAAPVLAAVGHLAVIGKDKEQTLRGFLGEGHGEAPEMPEASESREAWFWRRGEEKITSFRAHPPKSEHKRHVRKYAEGALGDEKSFYFTGPDERLRLKAQNLMAFLELGDGVDDDTWLYHLRRGDYSKWFRTSIKDDELAAEVEQLEADHASAEKTRELVRKAIEERYTAPA